MAAFRIVLNTFGLQGLKPVAYRVLGGINPQTPAGAANDYPTQDGEETANITGGGWDENPKSWLGTPVFCDVRFPQDGGKPEIELETVLVDVSQTKNIVTTAVQGRNGTIKEYVSDGDYEVRIRGAIVKPHSDMYPAKEVRELHELLTKSEALKTVSDYLRIFNIYSLVVKSFTFTQQEGFQNVQGFEINCISDTPDDLIEAEN